MILSVIEHYFIILFWNNKEGSQKYWHILTATIRLLLSSYIFYIVFGLHWLMIKALYMFLLMWWICFDILINLKRKKPLFYVGFNNYIDKNIRFYTIKLNQLLAKLGIKKYVEVVTVNMLLKLFVVGISLLVFL
jgi:hypothetical protein